MHQNEIISPENSFVLFSNLLCFQNFPYIYTNINSVPGWEAESSTDEQCPTTSPATLPTWLIVVICLLAAALLLETIVLLALTRRQKWWADIYRYRIGYQQYRPVFSFKTRIHRLADCIKYNYLKCIHWFLSIIDQIIDHSDPIYILAFNQITIMNKRLSAHHYRRQQLDLKRLIRPFTRIVFLRKASVSVWNSLPYRTPKVYHKYINESTFSS